MVDITVIIWISSFFAALLVISYVYLVWRKIKNQNIARMKYRWLEFRKKDIEDYLLNSSNSSTSFVPRKPIEVRALEDYFSNYLMNYKFEDTENPIQLFAEKHFIEEYKKNLIHRKWGVRMNTLFSINLYKMGTMQDDLLNRLKAKNCTIEEQYQIYIILASFNHPVLLELFTKDSKLPSFLLNEILNTIVDEENIDDYIDNLDKFHSSWKQSLLDVIRIKNLRSDRIFSLLEGLIYSPSIELRVKALKTLGQLGYISSTNLIVEWYKEQSKRDDWNEDSSTSERTFFARLLGLISKDDFIPLLEELISDKKYIVRSEAAKSLRKYKKGKERLLFIANNHSDIFSRNIAMEWLERNMDYE